MGISNLSNMTSFHFESCLRKVNYRINHAEGQAETSLQVLHACMNIFHFSLTQYVTIAVRRGRREIRNGARKKISTLLNWCTTHVSASWLGREIRGKCGKTCFLQHCSHFPFDSGYSGFWPVKAQAIILTAIYTISRHIKSCEQQISFSASLSSSMMHLVQHAIFCQTLAYLCCCRANDMWNSWLVMKTYIIHHHIVLNVKRQQGSYLLNIDLNI